MRILVINPGSTSTRVSVFDEEREIYTSKVEHAPGELLRFEHIAEQYALRRDDVLCALAEAGFAPRDLTAVVGRGGMLHPVESGTYLIGARMLDDSRAKGPREHISNLGPILAYDIAAMAGVPAYVVDPVSVDEFDPLARIAGMPGIERRSMSHALALKAAARRAGRALGRPYPELNLVVAHLGAGISVSAHRRGRMVDVNQGLDGTGPFSPERAGGLPIGDVMRLAYTGQYTYEQLFRLLTRQGGLAAHLGTNDAREVERRIATGDDHARLIYEAMAYQIAKEIGLMATVLHGEVQTIVLTGGLASSQMLVGWITARVRWIAPVLVFAEEIEMVAMAEGALRVLRGEEKPKEY